MLEKNKVYTLSEICSILRESQEFKPKRGEKVESENKKNNEKAVNDILKQGKKFDGGFLIKHRKGKTHVMLLILIRRPLNMILPMNQAKNIKIGLSHKFMDFLRLRTKRIQKQKKKIRGLILKEMKTFIKQGKK